MLPAIISAVLAAGSFQVEWSAASDPVVEQGVLGERIVMEDAVPYGRPGEPQLPVVPVTVALPPGAVVDRVQITGSESELTDLSFRPMACQRGVPLSRAGEFTVTPPSAEAFSSPVAVEAILSGQGTLMGYPVADILIRPFEWDPATEDLFFSRSVTLEIFYHTDNSRFNVPSRGIAGSQVIDQLMRNTVINPMELRNVPAAVNQPYGDYLIIADDDLVSAFEPLAELKTWKGIPTVIVPMSDIVGEYPGVDDAQKLRNFLFSVYQDDPPTYVLLAGDTPGVPHRNCYATAEGYTGDPSADLYFQDMNDTAPMVDAWNLDGDDTWGELNGQDNMDYHPDYILGRASVETAAEAEIFVNKVLAWEDSPDSDGWYTSMGFTTGVLWSSPYCPGSAGKEKVDSLYTPSTWDVTKLYQDWGTQSYNATMTMLNTGMQLVNHAGHGSQSSVSLGIGSLDTGDFMSLTNISERGRPSIWNTIACLSGSFDTGTCLAEAWIRSPEGGGFCIMNTRYGWGEPAEPGDQWSELVDQEFFAKFFTEDMYTLGTAYMMAKDQFIALIPTDTHYDWIAKSNTLFGDPELPMYTSIPGILETSQFTLFEGLSEVTITVTSGGSPVEGARVCLLQGDWDEPATYAVGLTDGSGSVTLVFDQLMPAIPDSARVTVWARDHELLTGMHPVGNLGTQGEGTGTVPMLTVNSPNPARGTASISWEMPSVETGSVAIVDLAGRTVERRDFQGLSGSFSWNTAEDPAGIYFVRLTTDSGIDMVERLTVVR